MTPSRKSFSQAIRSKPAADRPSVILGPPCTVTDGPFMETKETVAGHYLVDCVDMERAVEIAGKLGESTLWPIEIRRINP